MTSRDQPDLDVRLDLERRPRSSACAEPRARGRCRPTRPAATARPAPAPCRRRRRRGRGPSHVSSWTTPAPGPEQHVGQVGVGVEQRQHPPRLAAGDQPRRDRQPGPVRRRRRPSRATTVAAEPPAEPAYGIAVALGLGERVARCGWSPGHASGTRRAPTRCRTTPLSSAAVPPRSAIRPRIDDATPEAALGRGLARAGPAGCRGRRRAPRPSTASGDGLEQHPGRRVRRRRGRATLSRQARDRGDSLGRDARVARSTAPPGVATSTRTACAVAIASSAPARSTGPPAAVGTVSCCRISDRRLRSCSPASRPSSAHSPPGSPRPGAGSWRAPAARRRGRPGPAGCAPRPPRPRARRASRSRAIRCSDSHMKPTIGPPISSRKTLP